MKLIRFHRPLYWLLLAVALPFFTLGGSAQAQSEAPWAAEAEALLAEMSVEERVGQLFMVTFIGSEALPESDITDLIAN